MIGMSAWLVVLGHFYLAFALCSLSWFNSCPYEGHLTLAKRVFSYLKKFLDCQIIIESNDMDFSNHQNNMDSAPFCADFLQDYPWAKEHLDHNFPVVFGKPLQITILCDADHAHGMKTRRLVTGILAFVGCSLVLWRSLRQSSIACSTYTAEFMAFFTATEESIPLRYMVQCLGIPIPNNDSHSTYLFGDNLGVIQNATNPEAHLKKKHFVFSFHFFGKLIVSNY